MRYNKILGILALILLMTMVFVGCRDWSVWQTQLSEPIDQEAVTEEEYAQLRKGMYAWEVVEILGYPGEDVGSGFTIWEYELCDGRKFTVSFYGDPADAYQLKVFGISSLHG